MALNYNQLARIAERNITYTDYTSQSTQLYGLGSTERVQTQDEDSLIKTLENANIPITYQYINRIVRMLNDTAVNLGFPLKDYGDRAKNLTEGYFQDIGITDDEDRFIQNYISVIKNLEMIEAHLQSQHYGLVSENDKFGRNKTDWHKDIKSDNVEILDNATIGENVLPDQTNLSNLLNITDYGLKILNKTLLLDNLIIGDRINDSQWFDPLYAYTKTQIFSKNEINVNADKKIYFGSSIDGSTLTIDNGDQNIGKDTGNLQIRQDTSIIVDIDQNNDGESEEFKITHNNKEVTLFSIREDGLTNFNMKRALSSITDGSGTNLVVIDNTVNSNTRQDGAQVSGVNTHTTLNSYIDVNGSDGTTITDPVVDDPADEYKIYNIGLRVANDTLFNGNVHIQSGSHMVLPHSDDIYFRDDRIDLSQKMMVLSMIFG